MDRKCLICGHTNRETATFCESCGNRLSAITKRTFTRPSEPSYVESLKELGRSAGWGLGLIPISVIVGAVTGAVVAFVGAYLIHGIEWIRNVTGDSNLLVYVFGLIIGSILDEIEGKNTSTTFTSYPGASGHWKNRRNRQ